MRVLSAIARPLFCRISRTSKEARRSGISNKDQHGAAVDLCRLRFSLIIAKSCRIDTNPMSDVVQAWLRSGEYAVLAAIPLVPRHCYLDSSLPMVIESEEGLSYVLVDNIKRGWILKKFFPCQAPARAYTEAVQELIPHGPGFESGFNREVLKSSSTSPVGFYSDEFKSWIDGTILMPQVVAPTWADLAQAIRNQTESLLRSERLSLCWKLSKMIARLESLGLAHRDLSSENVLIDLANTKPHLIDWDNLYHVNLPMASNAEFGTSGYLPPFRKTDELGMTTLVWEARSDRFALAILNSEFLAAQVGMSCVETDGLLQQSDIDSKHGPTLSELRKTLGGRFPDALALLDQALNASSFAQCPCPVAWMRFVETLLPELR